MKKSLLYLLIMMPFHLMAQVFYENTTTLIENIPVNTVWSEFGPSFVGDQLWFSSFSSDEMEKFKKGKTKNVYYKLYASTIDSEGHYISKKELVPEGVSSGYHAGPVSFCENTGELFVTLSNFENAEIRNLVFQKKSIPLKIVILKKTGNT